MKWRRERQKRCKIEQSFVCADGRGLITQRLATEVRVEIGDWAGTQDFVAKITQELLLGFDCWNKHRQHRDFARREITLLADRGSAEDETLPVQDLLAPATADLEDPTN